MFGIIIVVTHTSRSLVTIGRRIRTDGSPPWPHAPAALSAIAVLGWLALGVEECSGLAVTAAWLVAVGLLLSTARWSARTR